MAPNSVELAARKDIDLTGPGQVLPEEVPRTILVVRRTDEIVRADRPAPGRECRGRLRAAALLRVRPPGQSCRRPSPRAIPPSCPSVRVTAWLSQAGRMAAYRGRPAPARQARFLTSGAAWSPAVEYQLRTLLFAICRRHEIRSQWGVVGLFPHRNGILPTFPFGIDVRHVDRAMEGFPVFP